jgi:2-hydroxychromene-2-carboxylate isomerase
MATLHFWFEFASTYSYVAASRVEAAAKEAGVALRYEPFLLGPIFGAQGWKDSPFNIYPVKGRYMWRDMARLCAEQKIPFLHPSVFPRGHLVAARVAAAAQDEPWLPAFVASVYRANFGDDRDTSSPEVIGELLEQQGQAPGRWLALAGEQAIKDKLKRQTDRAIAAGIFGAPSFTVGDELFWGSDRLAQALEYASRAR